MAAYIQEGDRSPVIQQDSPGSQNSHVLHRRLYGTIMNSLKGDRSINDLCCS
ncbi:MAG TPA: hypothetical protein V6D20_19560 [Candidatus Obscuribacterales bacterium]